MTTRGEGDGGAWRGLETSDNSAAARTAANLLSHPSAGKRRRSSRDGMDEEEMNVE